jgi:Uma2 family endonuclease
MRTRSLVVPETKPATEFLDGCLVQKMSPFGLHARVQLAVAAALRGWADARGRGRVGTEWDFDLTPPGSSTNRLVPDAAFLSYERVGFTDENGAQIPKISPNVAVEILSKGQTFDRSRRRIEIYLACGAELVIVIDPRAEEAWLVDANGAIHLGSGESIRHPALPEFSLDLRACFELVPPGGART